MNTSILRLLVDCVLIVHAGIFTASALWLRRTNRPMAVWLEASHQRLVKAGPLPPLPPELPLPWYARYTEWLFNSFTKSRALLNKLKRQRLSKTD